MVIVKKDHMPGKKNKSVFEREIYHLGRIRKYFFHLLYDNHIKKQQHVKFIYITSGLMY